VTQETAMTNLHIGMICNLNGNPRTSKNKKRMQLQNGMRSKVHPLSPLKTLTFALIPLQKHNKWSMGGSMGNSGLWWFSG